jgi:hypothetical protein
MARGGARTGAGRKTGALTKKTRAVAEAISAGGDTPLETLDELRRWSIGIFRKALTEEDHSKAAAAAEFAADIAHKQAPFVHPKLSSIDARVDASVTHEDALGALE